MTFLTNPFRHDIFVSYSHGDVDGSGRSPLKTWSQAFVRELEAELRSHPKFGNLAIFLDQHQHRGQALDPMSPLTQQLRDEIGKTGMLVVLMGPHYLHSTWCGDEREWWLSAQNDLGLDPLGRMAIVKIWPTDEPWPGALCDERGHPLVGFEFYDPSQGRISPPAIRLAGPERQQWYLPRPSPGPGWGDLAKTCWPFSSELRRKTKPMRRRQG